MKISHLLSSISFALGAAAGASANDIRWLTEVAPVSHHHVLGAPNFLTSPPPFTASGVGPIYRYGALSDILSSLPANATQRGFLIAFEGNGGSGAGVTGGWESSRWEFADGTNRISYEWNETLDVAANNSANGVNAVIATGPIAGPAYAKFFGMCCRPEGNEVMSYIIFDLVALKVDPFAASVSLDGWHTPTTGEGTPDPEAVGLVDDCTGDICRP
jgi:hypothetical protein